MLIYRVGLSRALINLLVVIDRG